MEGWTRWAACFIFTMTLLHPGSGFLFKKSSSYPDFDRNEISHLKRRYWNDDIQPCIEKFCMQYLGQKVYINCLQHYCPGSLLAVPRDLDAIALLPVDDLLGDTELCEEEGWGNEGKNSRATEDCIGEQCSVYSRLRDYNLQAAYQSSRAVHSYKQSLFSMCQQAMCSHLAGEDLVRCTKEKCCGQRGGVQTADNQFKMEKRSKSDRFHLSRKRRINDEVSQCIQSYCSGKNSSQRLLCIIANCNRM